MPDEAGIGQAPQSLAKAASERIRSGLSPKMINIAAAVVAPTAKPSRRVGAVSAVSRSRCRSCRNFAGEGQPATGEGPERVLPGGDGGVERTRSKSCAARDEGPVRKCLQGLS